MTSSPSSFFPRLSLGSSGRNSPLLPVHTNRYSPRQRNDNDYPLTELPPWASSPLLSPDYDEPATMNRDYSTSRKGKGKEVTYAESQEQFPPMSVVDRMRIKRENRAAAQEQMQRSRVHFEVRRLGGKPSWLPPSPSEFRDEEHQEEGLVDNDGWQSSSMKRSYVPQVSFVESVFLGRSQSTGENCGTPGEVDTTFRLLQQRERQMHKELQRLLDAQTVALERAASGDAAPGSFDAASTTGSNTPTRGTTPSRSCIELYDYESATTAPIIPVRQPKKKSLSPRQVRASIQRYITLLADLKAEEDACIESALLDRKTALARANKLSLQHKRIASELKALETASNTPLQQDLANMQKEHQTVCGEIEEFEQKLRMLKQRKATLERKMEQVWSDRESGLSGYRGALKEAERGIGEMMRRPGVKILEIDAAMTPGAGAGAENGEDQSGPHEPRISGQEFMRLRPERRTLGMAKEWWEGEVTILERRKAAVDRERAALEEGAVVWADVIQRIRDYEKKLKNALDGSTTSAKQDEKSLLITQLQELRRMIEELEKSLAHAEEKGWNLLVAAVGAELEGFKEGETILLDIMRANDIELPEFNKPTKGSTLDIFDTDTNEDDQINQVSPRLDVEDELSGSVVRRWTEPQPKSSLSDDGVVGEVTKVDKHDETARIGGLEEKGENGYRDESDNEVPPGLFSEAHVEESEDEHNEVPAEFLSMHNDKVDGPRDDASASKAAEKEGNHDDVD